MATRIETTGTKELTLLTVNGPTTRTISSKASRDCTPDEVPIIDLASLWGDLNAREALGRDIHSACEGPGFFYVKNHGIFKTSIDLVLDKAKEYEIHAWRSQS